jgi:DNA repair protein SbcC/Rad50
MEIIKMIKSIELENFQSHKKTSLEFSPGVNIIVGESRSGKTSVLRGLNWNRYNKPAGTAYNSYWNRNEKKEPKDLFSCSVTFDNSKKITRGRKSTFNGYVIDDELKLEAVGQDVPEQISNIWNMEEVNIQKQFDTPFLISESAAEIARFFNKTIKLDKIDKVLSKAESERRKINQDISTNIENKKGYEENIKKAGWIEEILPYIELAERHELNIRKKIETEFGIDKIIENIKFLNSEIDKIPGNIDDVLKVINIAMELDLEIEKKIERENLLVDIINNIISTEEILKSILGDAQIEKIISLFSEAENLSAKIETLSEELFSLNSLSRKIVDGEILVEEENKNLSVLITQMPKICPLCNQPLKEDVCL